MTVVSHPKTLQTLERVLSKTKFKFNILLLNTKNYTRDRDFVAEVNKYIKQNNIKTAGHITFVKNESGENPLTPWMILHCIGHAITEQHPDAGFDLRKTASDFYLSHEEHYGDLEDRDTNSHMYAFLSRFLSFRSAMKNNLTDSDYEELFNELVAEYLWNGGQIRMGHTPRTQINMGWENQKKLAGMPAHVTELEIQETKEKLEHIIFNALSSVVGHIIYEE